jgi:hypothetical protein
MIDDKSKNKYQCQWCQTVWDEEHLVADVFGPTPLLPDGGMDVSKLSCGYADCDGPVKKVDALHVYEDTLQANPPPPEDEFPF